MGIPHFARNWYAPSRELADLILKLLSRYFDFEHAECMDKIYPVHTHVTVFLYDPPCSERPPITASSHSVLSLYRAAVIVALIHSVSLCHTVG